MTSAAELLLWDIDGTLLSTGKSAHGKFIEVLSEFLDQDFVMPEFSFAGKTDPCIAKALLRANGVAAEDLDSRCRAVLRALGPQMATMVTTMRREGCVHPGVVALLHAQRNTSVVHTTVTGNIAVNAVLKLSTFGLDDVVDPEVGGFGSDHEERHQLVDVARKRVLRKYGYCPSREQTWIIGDTPHDFAAARRNDIKVALVATGSFTYEELADLKPDAVFHDLSDLAAVSRALDLPG